MDYLGWELERQRAALTALLLGGGTDMEREVRGGGTAAERPSAGEPGRRDGAAEFAEWELQRGLQTPGRVPARRSSEPETPVSAWEGVLGLPGGAGRQTSRRGGEPPPGGSDGGTPHGGLDGGAGVQAEPRGDLSRKTISRGQESRETERVPAAGEAARSEEALLSWETASGSREGGALFPQRRRGKKASGRGAELRRLEQADEIRRITGAEPAGQNGTPVFREIAEPAEPVIRNPWGDVSAQAEESAKALSRAVQRDARRYDGGFIIY